MVKRIRTLLAAVALAGAVAAPAGASPLQFGGSEVWQADLSGFPKWTQMLARFAAERQAMYQPCTPGVADCKLQQWAQFLDGLRGYDRRTQIEEVNRRMNLERHITDRNNYGMGDYWATPAEFFAASGDCEDYAIAKYLSLRLLGFSPDEMRIMVVHDRAQDLVHAVLVVTHQGEALVLDNQLATATPARSLDRYTPYFSINETGWWQPAPVQGAGGQIAARRFAAGPGG